MMMKFWGLVVIAIFASGASAFQLQTPPGRPFSRLFAFVNVDPNTPRDVPTMDQWATSCGVQRAEGFRLASDGLDVSAMTDQNVPANTPVLFVPNTMILSSQQAAQEMGPMYNVEKLVQSLNASRRHVFLVLKLLLEYEKGDQSAFYPWLNSLPRFFTNGVSMTYLCYKCLPPLVKKLAMKERASLSSFTTIVQQVPFLGEQTKDNKDLIQWAFQIAYTRSFEANDGDLRIAPLADMFNHGSMDPEIFLTYDDQGNCYAQTTRDVPAGSPLRMSYGDPTNPSHLFARYGFLDESSPATFCKIMIDQPTNQLVDLGYAHNRMLFYKDSGDVSPEVWDVLLYQLLGESNDAASQQNFYQAHMMGDAETKQAFHQQYYPQTSARLLNHIDSFLIQLNELSSQAQGKDLNEHPRLPLILRHNEFVRNTFLAVRARHFS